MPRELSHGPMKTVVVLASLDDDEVATADATLASAARSLVSSSTAPRWAG